jgi:hypothetical protein
LAKYGCFNASSTVILLLGSKISNFFNKSIANGEAKLKSLSNAFPVLLGKALMSFLLYSGINFISSTFGVPKY